MCFDVTTRNDLYFDVFRLLHIDRISSSSFPIISCLLFLFLFKFILTLLITLYLLVILLLTNNEMLYKPFLRTCLL